MEKGLYILKLILISFTLSTYSWDTQNHPSDCELLLVQAVYRHGDRNPIGPYPTDPYKNESFWPEGFGQLTKIGKMQHFELGQYLRKRYDGFLTKIYSPYEIYVQSSTEDRAIMSAQSNLAGLYPPLDERSHWNPTLEWQPIPVHSMSNAVDNTIRYSEPCPRYAELFNEFLTTSDVVHKVERANNELFQLLTNYTGMSIKSAHDAKTIFNVLFIQRLYNFSLPAWTTEILPKYEQRLEELQAFNVKIQTFTLELQRLRGGPLLKELIANMIGRVNGTLGVRRKFFMYSGHDTTVSALLNTLDMFNNILPPYTAMIILELHRNLTSNKYFVEVLYRNSSKEEPYRMLVPGCDFSCDWPNFLDLTKSRVPGDWEQECRSSGVVGSYDAIGILVTSFLMLIVAGLCVASGLILKSWLRGRRRRRGGLDRPRTYPYNHLQMTEGDEEPL